MKTLSLIVLVLSFTFTTPTMAADKDGFYASYDDYSCGDWVKYRANGGIKEITGKWWIVGYLTAYNKETSDVYNILGSTDLESVYLWMDKYCQENPLKGLSYGMDILTNELWPNRKRTADN
ncbi:MAG: hypothetical protein IIA06_08825 [Proteobacteria bacterium]|nr:hypothetical protein [Pseudomonadota bacterium]